MLPQSAYQQTVTATNQQPSPGIQALISGLKISSVSNWLSAVPPPITYRRPPSVAVPAQPRTQDMEGACREGQGLRRALLKTACGAARTQDMEGACRGRAGTQEGTA